MFLPNWLSKVSHCQSVSFTEFIWALLYTGNRGKPCCSINWWIGDLENQKSPFFANFLEFSIYENEIIIVKFILTYNWGFFFSNSKFLCSVYFLKKLKKKYEMWNILKIQNLFYLKISILESFYEKTVLIRKIVLFLGF